MQVFNKLIKNFIYKPKYFTAKCMICENKNALLVEQNCYPDFDTSKIPNDLKDKFLKKKNGICMNCGTFQDYNLLNIKQLRKLNKISKDKLTTEQFFLENNKSEEYIRNFNNVFFKNRLKKWDSFFNKLKPKIENTLILRYWFGSSAKYLKNKFDCNIYGIELSEACREVLKKKKLLKDIRGEINGEFIYEKLDTKFDLICTFHIIPHSINVRKTIEDIRKLLSKKGLVIFSSEIERKPTNPFHNLHLSEVQLTNILREYFPFVGRIGRCQTNYQPQTNPYTLKNDIPDIFATNYDPELTISK